MRSLLEISTTQTVLKKDSIAKPIEKEKIKDGRAKQSKISSNFMTNYVTIYILLMFVNMYNFVAWLPILLKMIRVLKESSYNR